MSDDTPAPSGAGRSVSDGPKLQRQVRRALNVRRSLNPSAAIAVLIKFHAADPWQLATVCAPIDVDRAEANWRKRAPMVTTRRAESVLHGDTD